MSVKVFGVDKNSKCGKKGIKSGYSLISVNGNEINDVLDYRFYADDDKLSLLFADEKGKNHKVKVRHSDGCDSLGLTFETYLMDKHRRCKNACIFCFIDQLPCGMRESLYFKDDDSRLSFLFGNYITLTNLSQQDVDRIIKMHISPINASVHTMNPELRVKMMKNPKAGESLAYLKQFSDAGIDINAQLVLCPGINDGEELIYSLTELSRLPSVNSVAAVPVGLTKHRDGLYPLKNYDKEKAAHVIDIINDFNDRFDKTTAFAFASDEFYQIAERQLPEYEYYRDFPQLDNGVGLYTLLKHEFSDAVGDCVSDDIKREFAVATGVSAFPLMKSLVDSFMTKYAATEATVYCIKNEFFGESVTVAGLVTGRDLIASLKNQNFSSRYLLLPSVMFKSNTERIFLDDVTVEEVEKELNTHVIISSGDGYDLFEIMKNIRV